jgi:hypothetical protein
MTDNRNILAGVGGKSLSWFAPEYTGGPVAAAGTAGIQTVTVSGVPTGGTFSLTYNGATTTGIAYNAAAAVVTAALVALSTVGAGKVTVTGATSPYTATFAADIVQVPLTASAALLTGGTTPAVAIAVTTPGVQATNVATAIIPAGFLDGGWCSDAGLAKKINEQSKQLFAYGTTSPVRTLISQKATTFDVTFLETNPVSLAIANRLPLGGVVADTSGLMQFTEGPANLPRYAGIFDIVDGLNHIRGYCPSLAATTVQGWTAAPGSEISYPVSFTAYPDTLGNSTYWSVLVDALKH